MIVDEWSETLTRNAKLYARLALRNIEREFPSDVWYRVQAADDMPRRPRERTPG